MATSGRDDATLYLPCQGWLQKLFDACLGCLSFIFPQSPPREASGGDNLPGGEEKEDGGAESTEEGMKAAEDAERENLPDLIDEVNSTAPRRPGVGLGRGGQIN